MPSKFNGLIGGVYLGLTVVYGCFFPVNSFAIRPKAIEQIGACKVNTVPEALIPKPIQAGAQPPISPVTGVSIDLLIGYTPDALAQVGTEAKMLTELKAILATTNQIHLNSGTGISFNLVGVQALTTNSTDNFSTDLSAVTQTDGVWDELISARETVGADMVSVVIGGTQRKTLCGLAWLNGTTNVMSASSDFMFSVVSVNKICLDSTLAHELAHNLGSNHDRVNAEGGASQTFAYGFRFTGRSKQIWHTVMAIPPDREIPFFSTPLLSYDSKPIGVDASEDNVTSLVLAAPVVAGFKTTLGLPNLAIPEPTEPNKIKISFKKTANGRKVDIRVTLTHDTTPVSYKTIELYFTVGRRPPLSLRAIGRTNGRGQFSFKEQSNVSRNVFFRACYPGSARKFLCTRAIEFVKAI